MTRKPRPARKYSYSVPDSHHLSGDVYRVSYEGFLRLVLHSYERRRPPRLHIGGTIIRVRSVKALEQLPGEGWIVSIEEWTEAKGRKVVHG